MIRGREIQGISQISLYKNSDVRLVRPNISVENEVNLIASGANSYTISEVRSVPTWERTVSYSKNYKQNYLDEFTFLVAGVENEIPEIIKDMRDNKLGYIADVVTTGRKYMVFQSPVFLNKDNTKQVNSHSWIVSLSYRVPTFLDRLTRLDVVLGESPISITSGIEITGIRKIALYINENVRINRPNPSIENEVDLIAHATGSYTITDVNEQPKWERKVGYSGNGKQNFVDTFTFLIHGTENNTPEIIRNLRNNRLGYICEIITTGGKSLVFQSPVFINKNNVKNVNSHSWEVSLSYREPTFLDKLTKLNTVLMTNSYILGGESTVVGGGVNNALIGS